MKREVRTGLIIGSCVTFLATAALGVCLYFRNFRYNPPHSPTPQMIYRTPISAYTSSPTPTHTKATETPVIVCGEVKKFNDVNRNGIWDSGENLVPGYPFKITRPDGTSYIDSTGPENGYPYGVIPVCGPPGIYSIEELFPPGQGFAWVSTTNTVQELELIIDPSVYPAVLFGNYESPPSTNTPTIPPPTYTPTPTTPSTNTPTIPPPTYTPTPEPTKVGDDL